MRAGEKLKQISQTGESSIPVGTQNDGKGHSGHRLYWHLYLKCPLGDVIRLHSSIDPEVLLFSDEESETTEPRPKYCALGRLALTIFFLQSTANDLLWVREG